MIELIVLLTVFTYGTNFVLYLILKNKISEKNGKLNPISEIC